tara:strand:- start:157 stop:1296 length:1140 start_codon:yes stop_codon:yes gene_type:complete
MSKKLSTKCIHSGGITDDKFHGNITPIYPSITYDYLKSEAYPRYFNTPNQLSAAKKIAELEGAEDAILFGSGLASVATSMFSLLSSESHVILQKSLYGGTINLVNTEFKKFNIDFDYVDVSNHDELQGALNSKTKIIYIESPSNPLLSITDIKSIASFAKKNKLISIIDNTFASPVNQNPISLGIDLVIHSATKYLGGHSDILAGVVCGSNDLISIIKKSGLNFGSNISEYISWLLERSIKTLSVRVLQQNYNALKIANFLSSHKKINKVYYPGLVNHPKHDIAKTQMTAGFGGMVSFELNDSIDSDKFVKTLKIIQPTMSLAGVESTITSPAKTSHRKMDPKDRDKIGITKNLLRFSVGIEDTDDLINDLSNALKING